MATRPIGRDREVRVLEAALDAAGGSIVAIVGEPGIGRSRLLAETGHPRRPFGNGALARRDRHPHATFARGLG